MTRKPERSSPLVHEPTPRTPPAGSPLGQRLDSLLTWIALICGGGTLIFMTVLSVWNVLVMRKALNAPIQGAEDVLILCLVVLVAIAIPYGARSGAHIEIEMLDPFLSPRVARVSSVLIKTGGFAVLCVMSWRLWESGRAAESYGESTQQLLISFGPFYDLLAVSIAIYAAVLLVEIVHLLRGHKVRHLVTESDAQ